MGIRGMMRGLGFRDYIGNYMDTGIDGDMDYFG